MKTKQARISRILLLHQPAAIWVLAATLVLLVSGCRTGRGKNHGGATPSFQPLVKVEGPDRSVPETDVAPAPELSTKDDPVAPSIEELNERFYGDGLLGEVYFGFDRAELDARARTRLELNADFLLRRDGTKLAIEGHCDERGTNEYNLALGHRRAAAARDYLVARGVDPEQLSIVSYGEEMGVCNLSNEGCWSRNRRAFFRVTEDGAGDR